MGNNMIGPAVGMEARKLRREMDKVKMATGTVADSAEFIRNAGVFYALSWVKEGDDKCDVVAPIANMWALRMRVRNIGMMLPPGSVRTTKNFDDWCCAVDITMRGFRGEEQPNRDDVLVALTPLWEQAKEVLNDVS